MWLWSQFSVKHFLLGNHETVSKEHLSGNLKSLELLQALARSEHSLATEPKSWAVTDLRGEDRMTDTVMGWT